MTVFLPSATLPGGTLMALDGFEAMREANGSGDKRHPIVHLQPDDPADIPRFGELDVSAAFQLLWAWPDPSVTGLDVPILGRERAWRMYPIRSIRASGERIVGGSSGRRLARHAIGQIPVRYFETFSLAL